MHLFSYFPHGTEVTQHLHNKLLSSLSLSSLSGGSGAGGGWGGPMCNWTQCTTNVLEFYFESIERCAKADVVLMQIGWSILPAGLGANGPPPGHIWEQFSVQCTPQGTRIVSTTDATKQESTWLELDGRLVQCKS
jgi:hypothetical protein